MRRASDQFKPPDLRLHGLVRFGFRAAPTCAETHDPPSARVAPFSSIRAFQFMGDREGGKRNRAGTRLPPVTSSYAGKVTGRSLGGQSPFGAHGEVTTPSSLADGDITPNDCLGVSGKSEFQPAILPHADPPSLDAGRSEATKMEKAGAKDAGLTKVIKRTTRVMWARRTGLFEG